MVWITREQFSATSPSATNQAWTADITQVMNGEGWLYIAAVLDFYSRQVVG